MLHHTASHCNTLQHTLTHWNTLQHTVTYTNMLQHTATHCVTLQHSVTYCNTLQQREVHCKTERSKGKSRIAHFATKWNTLQVPASRHNHPATKKKQDHRRGLHRSRSHAADQIERAASCQARSRVRTQRQVFVLALQAR